MWMVVVFPSCFNLSLNLAIKNSIDSCFPGVQSAHWDFENRTNYDETNEYTNIFEGKNVIVIHGESMMTNTIGLTFNGVEVTPTLNKLSSEGMYFSNFYSQVSVGTSSDSELTYNTTLMPTKSGTAFVSYSDKTYISTPKLLSKAAASGSAFHPSKSINSASK